MLKSLKFSASFIYDRICKNPPSYTKLNYTQIHLVSLLRPISASLFSEGQFADAVMSQLKASSASACNYSRPCEVVLIVLWKFFTTKPSKMED